MSDFQLSLSEVSLAYGGPNVLDKVTMSIAKGMRAALTGRNGEGKSTLLKVIAGELEPDSGQIVRAPGLKVVYVSQAVPADRPGDNAFNALSGGMRRRQILSEALLSRPDLLLLDEPTNHLDTESIDWLESMIKRQRDLSLLVVTHDRRFLRRIATRIYDLDRGELSGWECDYTTFVRRKAELMADEAVYWERKAKKLREEEAWIRKGVKARRTRNEGRVAALVELRKEFAARRKALGTAALRIDSALPGGVRVIKVEDMTFAYPGKSPIVEHLTMDILRGERLGLIGANGSGKTTLLKLLTGRLQPTSGKVTLGTNVEMVFFDQLRSELKPELSVLENMPGDTPYAYLAKFLFTPERCRTPVKALSGGERARLILAKLFLKPANLIVMDEPTNDLDIETLELLEEELMEFKGTILLVSHDREFMDNVVTGTLNLGELGASQAAAEADAKAPAAPEQERAAPPPEEQKRKKLSYNEQRELAVLPGRIEALEQEVAALNAKLATGAGSADECHRLAAAQTELDGLVDRWAELAERSA
ncbi:MAG: ATP-binding cassette domain-containing protein [Kiritimatiellae bacterium]|nr:ATP-binding cassette domain-containing protein [Kiritimatiellia bacterium]